MMRMGLVSVVLCMAIVAPANAGGTPALRDGSYEIRVNLELPNVEDMTASKVATLCLTSDGSHGFAVLSENNPLRRCPITAVQEKGDTLTFDIKCKGTNEAKASANYLLMGDSFRGRIAMQMGGKNMTMTETQAGRRVGACKANPPS